MTRVFYGVWGNEVFDDRKQKSASIEEFSVLKNVDFFNEGNPIQAFFGDKGFLIFDKSVNLLDALWRHMRKSEAESCGKCTPCRMGTKLIVDLMEELLDGEGNSKTWEDLYSLASQMRETSLCGVGKNAPVALIGALEHFKDKLKEDAESSKNKKVEQNAVSYITAPCIEACPAKLNVPRYIGYVGDRRPIHSLGVILQKYPMAATCGRVCVGFCEKVCRRNLVDKSVNIKALKRYVADYQHGKYSKMFAKTMCAKQEHKNKVAVIGAGPGGVSCAYHLLLKGYDVDIFDNHDSAGGMAAQGIPTYRLPKETLESEIDIVRTLGGNFLFGKKLGTDFTLDDLVAKGYKSIFLAIGCSKGTSLGVENEDTSLNGYMTGVDFLLQVHRHTEGTKELKLKGKVVIVGGGNVSMDCARSAMRLGADEVHVLYRRTKEDMPADKAEIESAIEEGIQFHFLENPVGLVSKGKKLTGVRITKMGQTEPDASGRRGVKAIEGSEYNFDCDYIISAIGQQVDQDVLPSDNSVELNNKGCIKTDSMTKATGRKGVFAGGDCVLGPATLIHAMADGMVAACSIDDYIKLGEVRFSPLYRIRQILSDNKMLASDCELPPVKSMARVRQSELDPEYRKRVFDEVEKNISDDEAHDEAMRCMRCFRTYSVITESPVTNVFDEHYLTATE